MKSHYNFYIYIYEMTGLGPKYFFFIKVTKHDFICKFDLWKRKSWFIS